MDTAQPQQLQKGKEAPQGLRGACAQLVAALKVTELCLKQPERADLPSAVLRERGGSFTIPFDLCSVCPQRFEVLLLKNMNQSCLRANKLRLTLKGRLIFFDLFIEN